MPIGVFTKCMSGDLSQVSKNGLYVEDTAKRYWAEIFNQHIKEHGLPEGYVAYLSKMTKALNYYNQVYHGKKWMTVKARVCEAEALTLLKTEGEKIETTCARVSKFMGFPVKANECTVVEFYNYIAIMASTP